VIRDWLFPDFTSFGGGIRFAYFDRLRVNVLGSQFDPLDKVIEFALTHASCVMLTAMQWSVSIVSRAPGFCLLFLILFS
jgi:hypothetical protein